MLPMAVTVVVCCRKGEKLEKTPNAMDGYGWTPGSLHSSLLTALASPDPASRGRRHSCTPGNAVGSASGPPDTRLSLILACSLPPVD